MKYGLSRGQLKEIVERGREMTVAIPIPSWIETDAGGIKYVYEVLDVDRSWIKSCYITTLDVQHMIGSGGSGLTGILGHIVHGQTDTNVGIVIEVTVALVDLRAVEVPRGRAKTSWPASVTYGDRRFP